MMYGTPGLVRRFVARLRLIIDAHFDFPTILWSLEIHREHLPAAIRRVVSSLEGFGHNIDRNILMDPREHLGAGRCVSMSHTNDPNLHAEMLAMVLIRSRYETCYRRT